MTRTAVCAFSLAVLLTIGRFATAEIQPESDQKVKYASYKELARTEQSGIDFKVVYRPGSRTFLIAAPHGGGIEPGTTEIATAIAGTNYGLYVFDGLKRDASVLFLPSVSFDEPELARVTKSYNTILAVHIIPSSERVIFIGGKNRPTTAQISKALTDAGYTVKPLASSTSAYNLNSFINKAAAGGVQIEIASAIVDDMFRGPVTNLRVRTDRSRTTSEFNRFAQTIRGVLENYGSKSGFKVRSEEEEPTKGKGRR